MSFDADSFLQSSVTESNDTKIIPCPVGEFQGIIDKVAANQWQSKDGTTRRETTPVQSRVPLPGVWHGLRTDHRA